SAFVWDSTASTQLATASLDPSNPLVLHIAAAPASGSDRLFVEICGAGAADPTTCGPTGNAYSLRVRSNDIFDGPDAGRPGDPAGERERFHRDRRPGAGSQGVGRHRNRRQRVRPERDRE